jgi:cytochrome c553
MGLCHAGATLAADETAQTTGHEACAACHGPDGNKPVAAQIPRLAGQHYDYLVEAMIAYRKGTRADPIMGAIAKPLTDEEIRRHATYFSRQEGLTTRR